MITAIGLELSTDVDMAAVAVASGPEGGRVVVDVAWYGSPDDAAAEADRLYTELDSCGLYLDPLPSAGVLDALRARGVWLHELGPLDVAAASWGYTTEVRARRVTGGKHPALRAAMRAALPRPLSVRFAFERRRVAVDMSALNAAAFALLGYRRNEAVSEPGAWIVGDGPPGRPGWESWPDGIPPWVRRV